MASYNAYAMPSGVSTNSVKESLPPMRHAVAALLLILVSPLAAAADDHPLLTGHAAYGDWHADAPGVRRLLKPADMPKPYATSPVANTADVQPAASGALPKVPPGFTVTRYAGGLDQPRLLRVAPNGDVFVAETNAGQIRVLRPGPGAQPTQMRVFAKDLDTPFGIAFYPPGPSPRWIYVAQTNAVVRYPYEAGDLAARSAPETIVAALVGSSGGHVTRDIQFSGDGKRMLVSVGSASNVADGMDRKSPSEVAAWTAGHALGAAWGDETDRADVLVFDPRGQGRRVYATGLRNCVGLALRPGTDEPWCATNERDLLGDDLVPDYVTRVREGAFYGWPWFYIGDHVDPRRSGERPDLAAAATVPDVLIQPHSAPLQLTFYDAPPDASAAFPQEYRGDVFVALHGSWNRAKRTGYKVVRVRLADGVPTGEYDDFLTGFVGGGGAVWGRPVGVAIAKDGALLVSEDANGTIWRIAPASPR